MTFGQKALFDTATIMAETNDGGIHAYFYPYRGFYSNLIKSLRLIGDLELIDWLKKAHMQFIKSWIPWNRIILIMKKSKDCVFIMRPRCGR